MFLCFFALRNTLFIIIYIGTVIYIFVCLRLFDMMVDGVFVCL
jgi:hypothetical protein